MGKKPSVPKSPGDQPSQLSNSQRTLTLFQTGGESLLWALSDSHMVGEPLPPSQLRQAKAHTRLLLMPSPSAQDPKCPLPWLVTLTLPTPHYSRPLVQAGAYGQPHQ